MTQLSATIAKKIKEIELHTQRLLRGTLVGDSRSAIKGTGLEFDQIREYQLGDDVRFIDWKASARMDRLLVKQYIEERSRTVMLAVDISGSAMIGSQENIKHDTLAQIASVLALVTTAGKDRVGLILFTDEIELFIPPGRGKGHIHKIMQELFAFTPKSQKTNITIAVKKLAQLKIADMIGFIISDFIDTNLDTKYLSTLCKQKELIGIRCLDQFEQSLPALGFLSIYDRENGKELSLDLRSKNSATVSNFLAQRIATQNKLLKRSGMTILDVKNNDTFIGDLIKFFRRRMHY